jgi:hypothetical protein
MWPQSSGILSLFVKAQSHGSFSSSLVVHFTLLFCQLWLRNNPPQNLGLKRTAVRDCSQAWLNFMGRVPCSSWSSLRVNCVRWLLPSRGSAGMLGHLRPDRGSPTCLTTWLLGLPHSMVVWGNQASLFTLEWNSSCLNWPSVSSATSYWSKQVIAQSRLKGRRNRFHLLRGTAG